MIRRGEVYWVNFDRAVGGEVKKTRPAVILSNDSANRSANRVQVVPLTTSVGRVYPWEAAVHVGGRPAKAMADQIRTVSKARITNQEGTLTHADLLAVEQAVRLQLGLP